MLSRFITFATLAFSYAIAALSGCSRILPDLPAVAGAAREGNVQRIEQLLAGGADPDVVSGVNNWTPLMHAIHKHQLDSVRVLLAHGARVNQREGGGVTALILAAGYGYADIVRMLLQAGADPEMESNDGTTALSAAVGGVPDIDRFTVGHCQTETVRTLLGAAPHLRVPARSLSVGIARFGGCAEVLRLVGKSNR